MNFRKNTFTVCIDMYKNYLIAVAAIFIALCLHWVSLRYQIIENYQSDVEKHVYLFGSLETRPQTLDNIITDY